MQVVSRLRGTWGSYTGAVRPLERRLRHLSGLERREEAYAFLKRFHDEGGGSAAALRRRWAEVGRQLRRYDHYEHTPEELAFGARLAWRGNGRCIGRLLWDSLEVFDCRNLTEPAQMAERIEQHMRDALGDGRVRSLISVFAPVRGSELPAYVESGQITQYAGHLRPDGSVLGDRRNVEATRICRSLGWAPVGEDGAFDILPVLIRDRHDRRSLFALRDEVVRKVGIAHPHHPDLAAMGLQWYAVPCVSDMILTVGGIDYPCAPFNGFYMGTEIASRNLVDRQSYDLLPAIARTFGLDPEARASSLWRDEALTEINRAVLHSFRAAGVTMIDHDTASEQFMIFHQREQSHGRRVPGDWRWIVPPQASGGCEVFHLPMRNFHPVPNFYRSRTTDGRQLMPFYGDSDRSRWARDLDRIVRRWKLWKRMAW